jgi:nicotinate-nucleotide adenylyltransferase
VSDREIRRPGPTYSVDTVEELVAEGWSVTLILGADAASGLDTWHDAERLAAHAGVMVVPRDDTAPALSPRWRVEILDMDPVDLSSTALRDLADRGEDISKFVPDSVVPLASRRPG